MMHFLAVDAMWKHDLNEIVHSLEVVTFTEILF